MSEQQLTIEYLQTKPREFLEVLEQLKQRLDKSFLFHTVYMKYFSEFGERCPYYLKAANMFTKLDLDEVKLLLDEANRLAQDWNGVHVETQTHS